MTWRNSTRFGAIGAFAAFLTLRSVSHAAFSSADWELVSARSAGAGGAWEAGPRSLDGALLNPAAIPNREGRDLMLVLGSAGLRGTALASAVLSQPVDEALNLALSYHGLLQASGLGYAENTLALSAAFEANPQLSLGARINANYLDAGSLGGTVLGASADFGARQRLALGEGQGLILACGIRNVLSAWPSKSWQRAVPVTLKGGVGWVYGHDLWIGTELARIMPSDASLPQQDLWRLGGEYKVQGPWSLRAGASTDPEQRWSLGAGWEGDAPGLRLHYAFLLGDADGAYSHRLQLEYGFAASQAPSVSVAPLQIKYEEGTKRVKEAKLAFNMRENQKAEAWQLEIRDKNGNVIRVIEGTGTPPGYVTWDGKNNQGAWVEDGDQVSYKLNIKTPDGQSSSRPLLAGDLNIGGGGLTALSLDAATQNTMPALLPVMGEDGKPDHFVIKMPSANGEQSSWKVMIKDSAGNVLQVISGTGKLPDELRWDGKDKQGMKIQDISGMQISLVATDRLGQVTQMDGSVYSQPGLALDWGEDKAKVHLELKLAPFHPGEPSWSMVMTEGNLRPLLVPVLRKQLAATPVASSTPSPIPTELPTKVPTAVPTEAPTAKPTKAPTAEPTEVPTAKPTKVPTAVPTEAPTAKPTKAPTAVPTEAPTAKPTKIPTAEPTEAPTAKPTKAPTAVPTEAPTAKPTQVPTAAPTNVPTAVPTLVPIPAVDAAAGRKVLSSEARIRIHSQLSSPRMAFAFMPEAVATAKHSDRLLSPALLARIREARQPVVVDVFVLSGPELQKSLLWHLQPLYGRYRGLGFSQLRLTGLVRKDENGGDALSRSRAIRMSELLVKEGQFKGEFIIRVKGEPGEQKGVKIEVLR